MLPKWFDPEKLFNNLYCKFKDSVIHSNTNYYLPFYDAIFEIVMTGCQIKSMHYDVDDNEKMTKVVMMIMVMLKMMKVMAILSRMLLCDDD